ncbi:MerR family transcriptional regulator [Streptomyces sp. TRM 70351]|nr:MerR family transcriptional regulator [Streptomyces sp. TRM 70351]MEE1929481.1 MerR family transcriptional regulator [Streptomyces sp. TRM 70351]
MPDAAAARAAAGAPAPQREYRAAELAEAAGITTRTLRFYRERRLLPPPRREGRIAWYTEHHLARLHTIGGLLARGHTLGGIADLLTAFEKGRDSHSAAELLGLGQAVTPPFSEETPVRLTPEELAGHFPGEDTPENLSGTIELGYLAVDGDELVHVSRRLLDASAALVREGIPLAAVLDAAREVRSHVEAIATVFADVISTHLLTGERPAGQIAESVDQLRPYAKQVVDAELAMALDRRVRTEVEAWLTSRPANSPDGSSDSGPADGPAVPG